MSNNQLDVSNMHAAVNSIDRVGNNIVASDSSQSAPDVVFLINNPVLRSGIIFAVSAYVRSESPLTVQLWRPIGVNSSQSDPTEFFLVDQLNFSPNSSALGQQDVC
jgi:hypothetical protein